MRFAVFVKQGRTFGISSASLPVMLNDILERHAGPYRFQVIRPASKPGFFRSQFLPGNVEREEIGNEAMALLNDPRDQIVDVNVWSEREAMFITTIRGEKDL